MTIYIGVGVSMILGKLKIHRQTCDIVKKFETLECWLTWNGPVSLIYVACYSQQNKSYEILLHILCRFEVMEKCWKKAPNERPSFKQLADTFEQMMKRRTVRFFTDYFLFFLRIILMLIEWNSYHIGGLPVMSVACLDCSKYANYMLYIIHELIKATCSIFFGQRVLRWDRIELHYITQNHAVRDYPMQMMLLDNWCIHYWWCIGYRKVSQ